MSVSTADLCHWRAETHYRGVDNVDIRNTLPKQLTGGDRSGGWVACHRITKFPSRLFPRVQMLSKCNVAHV